MSDTGGIAPPAGGLRRVRVAVRYVAKALITLATISLVTFVASNYRSPEEVARAAIGQYSTRAQIDAYIHSHSLDGSLISRFAQWARDFIRGDWGVSAVTNRPVMDDVLPRFAHTALLTAVALIAAIPISILLGLVVAATRRRLARLSFLSLTVILASAPEFVVGAVILIGFGATLRWFPITSDGVAVGGLLAHPEAYVMPAATLALAILPHVARITYASVQDSLATPYTQSAILRGLPIRRVLAQYSLRNASSPIANAVGLDIIYMVSGVVVVENLFAFPGIGQALVQAIQSGDALSIQAIAVLMGGFFIITSILVDALSTYLNPRTRTAI